MGSLSPGWRRPGISGDRAGRDGQKWGASCHDNGWGLLIGQGNERASKTFFFSFSFSFFFLIPPPWWNEYAHPGTNHEPTEHFGSSHMCCITSASSPVFSLCSYTLAHSRAGPSRNNCEPDSAWILQSNVASARRETNLRVRRRKMAVKSSVIRRCWLSSSKIENGVILVYK